MQIRMFVPKIIFSNDKITGKCMICLYNITVKTYYGAKSLNDKIEDININGEISLKKN
jgi:hypothetical protein